MNQKSSIYDIAVIGGGINGVGIAADAAGRGLKVALIEKGDLAAATSSASSKLIHGGLRYLETYEFALVRKALLESELLAKLAPHLVKPEWRDGVEDHWDLPADITECWRRPDESKEIALERVELFKAAHAKKAQRRRDDGHPPPPLYPDEPGADPEDMTPADMVPF